MKRMPMCLGHYELRDRECDGISSGGPEERMACVYRDRCVALITYCKDMQTKLDQVIEVRKENGVQYAYSRIGDNNLDIELAKQIQLYKITGGRKLNASGIVKDKPKKGPPPVRTPAGQVKAAASLPKARAALARKRASEARDNERRVPKMLKWLMKRATRTIGRPILRGAPEHPNPGDVYAVRTDVGVKVYVHDKTKKLLFYAVPRPTLLRFDVYVRATPSEYRRLFGSSDYTRLEPQEVSKEHLKIAKADTERITIVLEGVRKILNGGLSG